jgi:DNA-binding GntR family transcriptional regulator
MNKSEWAYTTLRARILQGAYAPRQRLVLSTLARELGVSSVPVREALRRLEAEGWVTFRPNIGAEVRPIDAREWVSVMEVRALTEARATALSAPYLTPADIARARRHNEDMQSALERLDPLAADESNRAFHFVISERCPNDYLRSLVIQVGERLDAMRRTVSVFVPDRAHASIEEHRHLIDLIAEGRDEETIERFARMHMLRTVGSYFAARGDATEPAATGDGAPVAGSNVALP